MTSFLLDTHIFIWLATGQHERISRRAMAELQNTENSLFLSTISVVEIELKVARQKFYLPYEWETARIENDCGWLQFTADHALALKGLPIIHRDPFDRLLAAQSLVEDLTFITHDDEVLKYLIKTLRA